MWALWGVFDYWLARGDASAKKIFDRGVETLIRNLARFDTGYWSLYEQSGTRLKMLASPFYHQLHIVQLRVMSKADGRCSLCGGCRTVGRLRAASQQSDSRAGREKHFQIAALLIVRILMIYVLTVKILYVSQYFPPEMGAPAARAAELSRHWARMGHDVTVLTGFPNHPTGVVPEEWRSRLASPSLHRNRRWRARRSHLAVAAAEPQGARDEFAITRRSVFRRRSAVWLCQSRTWSSPPLRNCCALFRGGGSLAGSEFPLSSKSAISGRNRWRPSARAAKAVCSIARWEQSPDSFIAAPTASSSSRPLSKST